MPNFEDIEVAQWTDADCRTVRVAFLGGAVVYVPVDDQNAFWRALVEADVAIADAP